jgi:AcrR family transcriptional regulator
MCGMTNTAQQISARLESCFAHSGFAEPGVDAVREAAGVSLRTLYKYFPSREDMVVGALDHRHRRYLDGLTEGVPDGPGPAPIHHMIERVAAWMTDEASTGCLFLSALAAHPGSAAIQAAVARHKAETRAVLAEFAQRAAPALSEARRGAIADALFVMHEGQVAASATCGAESAANAAHSLADTILTERMTQ